MGGRGSNSGLGSTNALTSVVVQSGDTADLSANPLKFGKLDKALTDTTRPVIESFEKKYKGRKSEYGILVDANGNVLQEAHGGKGSVSLNSYLYGKAEVMSHIHPRGKNEEGCLGGTFSKSDLDNFSLFKNLKVMRASAAEGTYSISKTDNFDRAGYHQWVKQMTADTRANYDKAFNVLKNDYKAGNIKWNEFEKKSKDAFNTYIVGVHNELLANQKKYGYKYTLEGWA